MLFVKRPNVSYIIIMRHNRERGNWVRFLRLKPMEAWTKVIGTGCYRGGLLSWDACGGIKFGFEYLPHKAHIPDFVCFFPVISTKTSDSKARGCSDAVISVYEGSSVRKSQNTMGCIKDLSKGMKQNRKSWMTGSPMIVFSAWWHWFTWITRLKWKNLLKGLA